MATLTEIKTAHAAECDCGHARDNHRGGKGLCSAINYPADCRCSRFKKACRGKCDHFIFERFHATCPLHGATVEAQPTDPNHIPHSDPLWRWMECGHYHSGLLGWRTAELRPL